MRLKMIIVALAPVLTLQACGSAEPDTDFPVPAEMVRARIEAATGDVKAIVEDSKVSDAERERAWLSFVDCAAHSGVEIYDWQLDPGGDDLYNSRPLGGSPDAIPNEPNDEIDSAIDACRAEHYNTVALVYSYERRLTGDELAEFDEAVATCLRNKGIAVPDDATREQMSEIDRRTTAECQKLERDRRG